MNNVNILDCTLRDGGYVNEWSFSDETSRNLINSLVEAKIDYIEIGYINSKRGKTVNSTVFKDIKYVNNIIGYEKVKYLVMLNLGDFDVENIQYCPNIFAIRLAFRKKEWREAVSETRKLIQKGFKVFVQPMIILSYNDNEILEMIEAFNKINIYAFYLVDSFGAMHKNDVLRLALLINNNLKKNVKFGFHAHNNLQLAYSNAVTFVEAMENRDLIIDSSVFGMGRGAGNLNTELFANYLTKNFNKEYKIEPLLDIIDNSLSTIYREHYWGYSVAHYISGIYNCHPNYSTFLVNKKKLLVKNIENIVKKIDASKKYKFDANYIEQLYIEYNSRQCFQNNYNLLQEIFKDKEVLIIAPGKSITGSMYKIKNLINDKIISVSLNCIPKMFNTDYIFFNNEKRYVRVRNNIKSSNYDGKIIVSSNLNVQEKFVIKYNSLLGITNESRDNAAILFINLLIKFKAKRIYIAGLDGYEYNNESYFEKEMQLDYTKEKIDEINNSLNKELLNLKDKVDIKFITPSNFLNVT